MNPAKITNNECDKAYSVRLNQDMHCKKDVFLNIYYAVFLLLHFFHYVKYYRCSKSTAVCLCVSVCVSIDQTGLFFDLSSWVKPLL